MSCTRLGIFFMFAAGMVVSAAASTFVVDFNPAAPANTNGWDFGTTTANATKSGTQPGGRKFDTEDKEVDVSIESPVYESKILSVALSAWGNSIKTNGQSKIEVFGRASSADAYQLLFSRTVLSNKARENEPHDRFSVSEDVVCHQIKIAYTKDQGTLTLSTVTIVDDAIRAETPTNVRITSSDAATRGVTVGWDLAEGLTTSEYKVDVVTTTGGIDDSNPIWRETFDNVPASKSARQVDAKLMSDWGLSDWEFDGKVYQKTAGTIMVGGESSADGTLMTPPLGKDIAAGSYLLLRAQTFDKKTGDLPVYGISGMTTNCITTFSLSDESKFFAVALPSSLAAADRIQLRSGTTWTDRRVVIDDVAICKEEDFRPEYVSINAATAYSRTEMTSMSFSEPEGRTQLWFSVRSVYGDESSDWSEPIRLVAAASPDGADDGKTDGGGDASGGGDMGDAATLTAPTGVRAGTLPDGRIRLGWTTPDAASNVTLRVWTLSQAGGLAEASEGDFLWRETFANAPATNNTVKIDSEEKFSNYTDKGTDAWNVSRTIQVLLSPDAGAVRIGTGDKTGALESNALNLSGEGITLVVKAKRGSGAENSGVVLRAAILSDSTSTTNEIGTAAMAQDFAEYAFRLSSALTGDESLLLSSEIGSPKDGRIIIDDIALVRNYKPIATVTNEVALVELDEEDDEYELDATNVVRYAALCARDAAGETSGWTEPLPLDPATLEIWKDHHLTLKPGKVSATLDVEGLYNDKRTKLDVTHEPFRFSTNEIERLEIGNWNVATKTAKTGIFVYTNVFARNWIVLLPADPGRVGVTNEASMRVAIDTTTVAARKISLSGTFAQLDARNAERDGLLFQWRYITKDDATDEVRESAWFDFGSYEARYTTADASPDLAGTVSSVAAEAKLRTPEGKRPSAGARVEVRVVNRRGKEQKEAPLGFRDVCVSAESAPQAVFFVIR